MNIKNMKKHLKKKVDDWLESIDNEEIKQLIKDEVIISGGALVSLLTSEDVNDYDVYFKTPEAAMKVAQYYIERLKVSPPKKWADSINNYDIVVCKGMNYSYFYNEDSKPQIPSEETKSDLDNRVWIMVKNVGMIKIDEDEEVVDEGNSLSTFPDYVNARNDIDELAEDIKFELSSKESDPKAKYRPTFISSNAITLTDDIQIVFRFTGQIGRIHENYDYQHCKVAWEYKSNNAVIPKESLVCMMNKELRYCGGSRYPVCSIIRSRKFINRGWYITAGQYMKMIWDCSLLDLTHIPTLQDQLMGVDSFYFGLVIDHLKRKSKGDVVDGQHLIEIINKVFE